MFWLALATLTSVIARAAEEEVNPLDPLAHVPSPLREAVRKVGRDAGRWAYTQHTVSRGKGKEAVEDVIARYDPSQHYDVQWTLLKVNGKPATPAQIRKHRKERAKLEKNRTTLGELMQLDQAKVVAESEDTVVYEVPIRLEKGAKVRPEQVRILLNVARDEQVLTSIDLKLLEPIRAFVVAKLSAGGVQFRFAQVDPEFPPPLVTLDVSLKAKLGFVPVEQNTRQTRSDFKRVKPYDERFNVKLGPLQTIDF